MFYAHFEDFVDGYVGPFDSTAACDAHAEFCKARGDSSKYHGAVQQLPQDAFVISEEKDKGWKGLLKLS